MIKGLPPFPGLDNLLMKGPHLRVFQTLTCLNTVAIKLNLTLSEKLTEPFSQWSGSQDISTIQVT